MNVNLFPVLHRAWSRGFKSKSNFARANAPAVAAAASCGLITSLEPGGAFGEVWHVTQAGIAHMHKLADDAFEGSAPAFFK